MLNKERPEVKQALVDFFSDDKTGDIEKIKKLREKTHYTRLYCISHLFQVPFRDWLNSEYVEPFEITKTEKCILEELAKITKSIGRNESGLLIVFSEDGRYWDMTIFSHLFEFIKENKSFEIKYILENCEVIDQ